MFWLKPVCANNTIRIIFQKFWILYAGKQANNQLARRQNLVIMSDKICFVSISADRHLLTRAFSLIFSTHFIIPYFSPYFRPRTPTEDDMPLGGGSCLSPLSQTSDFYMESFANHQEQLLAMQRAQEEQLMKNTDLDRSFGPDPDCFSSQPTSRFTVDSDSARFAASAVCTSTKDLIQPSDQSPMTKPLLSEQSIKQESYSFNIS